MFGPGTGGRWRERDAWFAACYVNPGIGGLSGGVPRLMQMSGGRGVSPA